MPRLWAFSIHLFTWLLVNRGQCFSRTYSQEWNYEFTLHIVSFIRKCQIAFKNVCTNIQSIWLVWVPVILYPCQNVMFLDLLSFANLVGVKWHLTVVLIGISLITKEVEVLLYSYDTFTKMSAYTQYQLLCCTVSFSSWSVEVP